MKIAIDARWIFEEISGIGAYTRELIKHISLIDKENTYILFFSNPAIRDRTIMEIHLDKSPNFSTLCLPFELFSIKNQILMPGILKHGNFDIFHSTNYMIPLFAFPRNKYGETKCVVTIHDVIPLIFPHHAPKSKKSRIFPLYRRIMLEIGLRADLIIVDSLSSKTDVIKHLKIPHSRESKVETVYCGVSEQFIPAKKAFKEEYPNSKLQKSKTILYVGRTDPYKNLTTLIKAFAKAQKKCTFPITLTVAGSRNPHYPEALITAKKAGVWDSIKWTGYLSDNELVSIYQNADILVQPSKYEGFGLQVAEAMACGIPVICSNAGSLPEIAGNATIMFDPEDIDGLADNIEKVFKDESLANELSGKGIKQVSNFTWKRTAKETIDLYKKACITSL